MYWTASNIVLPLIHTPEHLESINSNKVYDCLAHDIESLRQALETYQEDHNVEKFCREVIRKLRLLLCDKEGKKARP